MDPTDTSDMPELLSVSGSESESELYLVSGSESEDSPLEPVAVMDAQPARVAPVSNANLDMDISPPQLFLAMDGNFRHQCRHMQTGATAPVKVSL